MDRLFNALVELRDGIIDGTNGSVAEYAHLDEGQELTKARDLENNQTCPNAALEVDEEQEDVAFVDNDDDEEDEEKGEKQRFGEQKDNEEQVALFHSFNNGVRGLCSKRGCALIVVVVFLIAVALVITFPQTLQNAHKWLPKHWYGDDDRDMEAENDLRFVAEYRPLRGNYSLPRVPVCVVTESHKPQKPSLFIRNYLQKWGSELEFFIEKTMAHSLQPYYHTGQIEETEWTPKVFSFQGKVGVCPPTWPKIHLAARYTAREIQGKDVGAPKVSLGDEFCINTVKSKLNGKTFAFRQYYSEQYKDMIKWVPLGPRFEWKPVEKHELKPLDERTISYSFEGSMTSHSRAIMITVFDRPNFEEAYPWAKDGRFKYAGKWSKFIAGQNEHRDSPKEYRDVMLDTVFALIPSGQSPEAFRIYEAIDAGAIPVFSFDRSYRNAGCKNAMAPFINSNAPFVWVKGWENAPDIMDKLLNDKKLLNRMQLDLIEWRASFWNNITTSLDCEIMTYFAKFRPDDAILHPAFPNGLTDLTRFCDTRALLPFPVKYNKTGARGDDPNSFFKEKKKGG